MISPSYHRGTGACPLHLNTPLKLSIIQCCCQGLKIQGQGQRSEARGQGQGLVVRGQGLKTRRQGQGQGLVCSEDNGLEVRGQGQGLLNWYLRILEDKDSSHGQQHWYYSDKLEDVLNRTHAFIEDAASAIQKPQTHTTRAVLGF